MSIFKQTKPSAKLEQKVSKDLVEKVESLITNPVVMKQEPEPGPRKVNLIYSSCCGCGCSSDNIIRKVPFDSDLQDGDVVYDFIDGDVYED
jgi:hypothetical protein